VGTAVALAGGPVDVVERGGKVFGGVVARVVAAVHSHAPSLYPGVSATSTVGFRDKVSCRGQGDGAGAVVSADPPVVVGGMPIGFRDGEDVGAPLGRRLLEEALGRGAPLEIDLDYVDHLLFAELMATRADRRAAQAPEPGLCGTRGALMRSQVKLGLSVWYVY